ncbi:MAG: Uma2 family endonuclease [Mucilaginibacter polytrichastri]|nr:Uma2 family endonuclease [Mucilaginibacter polytrichastri]
MLALNKNKKERTGRFIQASAFEPFEVIQGEGVIAPSTTLRHQLTVGKLYRIIANLLNDDSTKGVCLLSPMNVHFNEDNTLQPDLVFICGDNLHLIEEDGIHGAPDVVFEVLQPENAYYDLRLKKDIYEQFGVKEYWIIDPMQKTIEIYVLEEDAYQLAIKKGDQDIVSSTLLRQLVIRPEQIFS